MKRFVPLAALAIVIAALFFASTDGPLRTASRSLLAALPILVVIGLMAWLRWGGHRAGPAAWLAGLVVGLVSFGLTLDVFWVSQAKGLLLSLFVMAVLWPALFLYNIVDQAGGIRAIAHALSCLILDRGLLLIIVAWAFSGMMEGLAGFGIPIAIISPILVGLGVSPVLAVAAVAVGHAWSVTFGDMGVIFETLVGLVDVDETRLAASAALMLGAACIACGLATAHLLKMGSRWPVVLVLGLLMGLTQFGLAVSGLTPLAALVAGFVGILGGVIWSRLTHPTADFSDQCIVTPPLIGALLTYGGLTLLMVIIFLVGPVNDAFRSIVWKASFPAVTTRDGFATAAGSGQVFRPLVHPGASIILLAVLSLLAYRQTRLIPPGTWRVAAQATWRGGKLVSAGVISMVGLSTLMDHTGMTLLLAEAVSDALQNAYPLVSPLVGILGAFATGSNNNSNVLFARLQENAALLLSIAPTVLLAAQTTGGSLGSMLAPAKIMVGCSTVGLKGQDGEVLRLTLPYGIGIGLGMGVLALVLAAT